MIEGCNFCLFLDVTFIKDVTLSNLDDVTYSNKLILIAPHNSCLDVTLS